MRREPQTFAKLQYVWGADAGAEGWRCSLCREESAEEPQACAGRASCPTTGSLDEQPGEDFRALGGHFGDHQELTGPPSLSLLGGKGVPTPGTGLLRAVKDGRPGKDRPTSVSVRASLHGSPSRS